MAIRIGFVGSGGIGGHHMRQLVTLENAKMVAFCDVVKEKAEAAVAQYGGTAYTDYLEMYEKEALDAVYICLPPFAHADQELLAVERGLPIFVEKPIGLSPENATRVAEAIERKGVANSVGYHFRYMQSADRAKALLAGEEIGFALGSWIGGMPGVHWWRVMEESGGQMVEQTTHIFDLARYLLGEIIRVQAIARTGLMADVEDYTVHDATHVNLEFASGVIANITSACMVGAGGRVGLDIYTKNRTLKITSGSLEVIELGRAETLQSTNNPYLDEDKVFLAAVESGDGSAIRSSYADALKTLKVTLAANQSIAERKAIEIG